MRIVCQGPGKRSVSGVRAQTPERDQTEELMPVTQEIKWGSLHQRPGKRSDWGYVNKTREEIRHEFMNQQFRWGFWT
jgi:hypothetical protein